MTLPQILVDLMKLLFDMAVPVAICTMVLAGMALRQEGGVNRDRRAIPALGIMVGHHAHPPPVPVLVCGTRHLDAAPGREHQQWMGEQR